MMSSNTFPEPQPDSASYSYQNMMIEMFSLQCEEGWGALGGELHYWYKGCGGNGARLIFRENTVLANLNIAIAQ